MYISYNMLTYLKTSLDQSASIWIFWQATANANELFWDDKTCMSVEKNFWNELGMFLPNAVVRVSERNLDVKPTRLSVFASSSMGARIFFQVGGTPLFYFLVLASFCCPALDASGWLVADSHRAFTTVCEASRCPSILHTHLSSWPRPEMDLLVGSPRNLDTAQIQQNFQWHGVNSEFLEFWQPKVRSTSGTSRCRSIKAEEAGCNHQASKNENPVWGRCQMVPTTLPVSCVSCRTDRSKEQNKRSTS